ncbi:MAG: M28 family peptidase [Nitrospirota bacterium]|nr:M28 family peptidase [Nitrospirota bacterium]
MQPVEPSSLPIASDQAKALQTHVRFLADPSLQGRKPGTQGNRAAAEYIKSRFQEAGLVPLSSLGGYGQSLPARLGDNLLGLRPAAEATAQAPYIIVGAHYDHLGGAYLGADDNASGVAILIELARTLPASRHHHVLFAAFNAEEPPYIRTQQMGSQYFADHLPQEIGSLDAIQAVVIMDIMGGVHWEPLRETVVAAGAEKSPGLYRRLKEASGMLNDERGMMNVERRNSSVSIQHSPLNVLPLGLHLIEELPLAGHVPFSDYDAFRNASVPFLFLSSGRTPRYHQPTDLPETLHYERMAATVRWLERLLSAIDQDRDRYRFDADRLELADEVATLQPLAAQAAERGRDIPGTSWLSRRAMQRDVEWLKTFDPRSPQPEDITRLERLSLRIQCLLADLPVCFLL